MIEYSIIPDKIMFISVVFCSASIPMQTAGLIGQSSFYFLVLTPVIKLTLAVLLHPNEPILGRSLPSMSVASSHAISPVSLSHTFFFSVSEEMLAVKQKAHSESKIPSSSEVEKEHHSR